MSVIKPILQCPELIAYFLGANNYCWLYFRTGEKKLLAKPISYLEKKLPGFIRVHKTVLINPAYVKSLQQPPRQKMAGEIKLTSGEVFPVSRRRWPLVAESLQYYLKESKPSADNSTGTTLPRVTPQQETAKSSIFLVTDDEQNTFVTKQIIEKEWSAYQLYTRQQSSHLPDILRLLPQENWPVLLLLDARTATLERLHTLQRLKDDSQLNSIPVILFVNPTDQAVTDGYDRKANSVIAMPDSYNLFTKMVERVCQFWLCTVALPGAQSPDS